MITWYVVLALSNAGAVTQRSVYTDEIQACDAYLAAKATAPAVIYELSGRKSSPTIDDGDCPVTHHFVTTTK